MLLEYAFMSRQEEETKETNSYCIFVRRGKAVNVRMFPGMATAISKDSSTRQLFIHCYVTVQQGRCVLPAAHRLYGDSLLQDAVSSYFFFSY